MSYDNRYRFFIYNSCILNSAIDVSSISTETIDGISYLKLALSSAIDTDMYKELDDIVLSGFSNTDYNGTTFIKSIISSTSVVVGIKEVSASGTPGDIQLYSSLQVYPLNFFKSKLVWEREDGQIFYRKKLDGKLKFSNKCNTTKDNTDFDYFHENILFNLCCPIKFVIEKRCTSADAYERHFVGSFTHNDCAWDLDKCTAEVQPEPDDTYKCILDNWDTEENYAAIESDQAVVDGSALPYEFEVVEGAGADVYTPSAGYALFANDLSSGDPAEHWAMGAREIRATRCIGGTPSPPPVGVWTLLSDTCDTKGFAKYTRAYTGSVYNPPDVYQRDCVAGEPDPLDSLDVPLYNNCNISDKAYWFTYDTVYVYDIGVSFVKDVLAYLATRACPKINKIVSDFFEINPAGDAPGYIAGKNYVTFANGTPFTDPENNGRNQLDELIMMPKKDAKTIIAGGTTPQSLVPITLEKVLEDLNKMFNVFWFIDANFNLRIEHDSYFSTTTQINAITPVNNHKNRFDYNKVEIPVSETFTWMEADGIDFVGAPIQYTTICANPEKKEKIAVDDVTTDIIYVEETVSAGDPGDIADEGFIYIASRGGGTPTAVIHEKGRISNVLQNNGHLSWANLHWNYHRHRRPFDSFIMNYEEAFAFSERKYRQQKGITVLNACCVDLVPEETYVTTELGNGEIDKATFYHQDNTLRFDLLQNEPV